MVQLRYIVILCGLLAIGVAQPSLAQDPGYFVAPNGTNNSSCSISQPCTFAAAQAAMRRSSTKVTYVRAGTYTFGGGTGCGNTSCGIYLSSGDAGETWQYYPPDGVDSAILDGQSSAPNNGIDLLFAVTYAPNVTVDGLTFRNFVSCGVCVYSDGAIVRNSVIYNGTSEGPGNPGGVAVWMAKNVRLNNNDMSNIALSCITVLPPYDGLHMDHNYIDNCPSNTSNGDAGPIYFEDPNGAGNSSIIEYNYVHDCFPDGSAGRCIYLDNGASNAVVSHNVLAGAGNFIFYSNAGHDFTMSSNIIDMGTQEYLLAAAWPMGSGVVAAGNIVISPGGGGWWTDYGSPAPAVQDNLYWNYGGSGILTTGDSAPVTGRNPGFLSCPGGGVDSWAYMLDASSPAFGSPVNFPAPPSDWGQPGFWGPPGFTIPHVGTPPSYGPTC